MRMKQYLAVVAVAVVIFVGVWATRDGGWIDTLIFGGTASAEEIPVQCKPNSAVACAVWDNVEYRQRWLQYVIMVMRLFATGGRAG